MISKKVIIILVIVAILLATVSVSYSMVNAGKKIPTDISDSNNVGGGQGEVGVTILSPAIEDKSAP